MALDVIERGTRQPVLPAADLCGQRLGDCALTEQQRVTAMSQEVGTRTYSRVAYVVQALQGRVDKPDIYHCYHMCRDLAASLRSQGVEAWSVMGHAEIDGFKQLHPMVVVRTGDQFKLYDPAFGILDGLVLDGKERQTPDGKYRVSQEGPDIRLDNLGSKKTFHYRFTPDQASFSTDDGLLVRRNNFPGDAYTMTYCYDPQGRVRANVSVFHVDKQDSQKGCVMIMLQEPTGEVVSRRFSTEQVREGHPAYRNSLTKACACLGRNDGELHQDVRFILDNIGPLRELQRVAKDREIGRQRSGAPLW